MSRSSRTGSADDPRPRQPASLESAIQGTGDRILEVRVVPRANRDEVEDRGGMITVWVRALPSDGEANEAVRRVLAKWLGVAKSLVELERGARSRTKRFRIRS